MDRSYQFNTVQAVQSRSLRSGLYAISSRIARPKEPRQEIFAGLTLAALGLPTVMGYALIAGMPIVTGLYSFLAPLVVFVLLGSTRHLVVASDSATAAILVAGLAPLAALGSPKYIGLASLVALLVGLALLLVRILRLGFLSNFLSRTILVGFLTGVGIQITLTQLPKMLWLNYSGLNPIHALWFITHNLKALSPIPLVISGASLLVIYGLRRINPRLPGPFTVVSLGMLFGYLTRSLHLGLTFVGAIHPGLPALVLPRLDVSDLAHLLGLSLSILVVIIAQSSATSRAFTTLSSRKDQDADLTGLAAANIASSLTGGFVVNSSPTRAAILEETSSTTRWPAILAALVTVLVLVFATAPLRYLPLPVLAAVVVYVALRLIDIKSLVHIARLRWDEFIVAASTALAVVILGVQYGVVAAMILALINHLRRSYSPANFLVILDDKDAWASAPLPSAQFTRPGIFVYRFQASLWYANIGLFVSEVQFLVSHSPKILCLDFTSVANIDYSAGLTLAQLLDSLPESLRVIFTHVDSAVLTQLKDYCVTANSRVSVLRSTREAVSLEI